MKASLFATLLLLLLGCSAPGNKLASDVAQPAPVEPYVRISNTQSNLLELQIAIRRFVPPGRSGPSVWLTGVSHLGETNYFAAVQQFLDLRTLVLFEGVGESEGNGKPSMRDSSRSSLQNSMAASLGLVFQLDAIDYTSPRFRHSDLSVRQLRSILAQQTQAPPTEPGAGQATAAGHQFEGLLKAMQGDSLLNTILQFGMRFIRASPKLQALSRLALMDILERIQGDPLQIQGLPPSWKRLLEVLIEERNRKVSQDLGSALKTLGKQDSVSIFYGTGHMPDLEKRLRQDWGYRPASQMWFTVFSVDLAKAGISPSERAFVENLIKQELEQFQGTK